MTISQFRQLLDDAGLLKSNYDYNIYASEWAVVKACLVSGLYPNVARITQVAGAKRLYDSRLGNLKIHPSSVLSRQMHRHTFDSHWGMYSKRIKTDGGVFLFDFSQVSPISLLLSAPSIAVLKLESQNTRDEIVRLTSEIVRSMSGQVGLAKLSRLLKRLQPNFKSSYQGGIRKFLERNGFCVEKIDGYYIVRENVDEGGHQSIDNWYSRYIVIDEWIYFKCDEEDVAILQRARSILKSLLQALTNATLRQNIPTNLQLEFIDCLKDMF